MKNEQKVPFHFLNSESELSVVNLGDVIDIASASRVHKNEWTLEGVRFFRSSDVTSNFFGKDNKPAFISFDLYKSLIKKTGIVKKGDILVTGGGTIGIPYLIDNDHPLYFKDADLLWLKSHNVIDGYYLYSYFSSPSLQKYLTSISHVGTISHYTIEQAKATPIKLPTFDEQKKIGLFFKDLDDTISLHQQELDALKQTKQGFLQKMFPVKGKKVPEIRFSGYTHIWKKKDIGEVFDTITDYVANGSFKSLRENVNSYESDNYAYLVRLQDASNQWRGPWLYTDEESYNFLKKTALYPNDIIMSNVGSVGKFFLVPYLDKPMTLAPNAMLIRSSVNDNHFIYQMMLTKNMQANILEKTTPGVQSKINKTDFKKIETYVPDVEEQTKIGKFFKQLDEVIELKEQELEALKQTKKGFLQKMFI